MFKFTNIVMHYAPIGVGAAINVLIIAVIGGIRHPIGPFIGSLIVILMQTFAIDLVRAAADLPRAGHDGGWYVIGHSQGGHAALFTGEEAPSYAPELDLKGVVAGAPPTGQMSDPAVVGMPRVVMRSLIVIGTPSRGRGGSPAARARSASRAARSAPLGSSAMISFRAARPSFSGMVMSSVVMSGLSD